MDSGRRPLQARAEDLELYERLKSSKDYADGGPLKKLAFTPQHAMRNVLTIHSWNGTPRASPSVNDLVSKRPVVLCRRRDSDWIHLQGNGRHGWCVSDLWN